MLSSDGFISWDDGPPGTPPTGGSRRRGRPPVLLAAFACAETERLGRLLGSPLAVLAVTTHPAAHAQHLAATQHAGWAPREGWFQPFDDFLTIPQELSYRHLPFDVRWLGPLGRAVLPGRVRLVDGCLAFDLPDVCAARDLGQLFATAMAPRRFEAAAATPTSVRRRFATGRPLHLAPRYALARPHHFDEFKLVEDLYRFHPRDLHAVATAAAIAASGLHLSAALDNRKGSP